MKNFVVWLVLAAVTGALCVPCLSVVADTEADIWIDSRVDTVTEDGFEYRVYEDHVRLVGYRGEGCAELLLPAQIDGLPVRYIDGYPVYPYQSFFIREYPEIECIVIPEGVVGITQLNGENTPNLTDVLLPESLRLIGKKAFGGAASLKHLTIPDGVQFIVKNNGVPPTVTLHGTAGGYAARYAAAHGLAFEPTVYAVSPGDVNADGVSNSTDARMILQHAVQKIRLPQEAVACADLDGDGAVTSTDARLCLQAAVGKAALAAITVPSHRVEKPLVSSQAEVYAVIYTTVAIGPSTAQVAREPRDFGPVADRAAAIEAINRLACEAYYTQQRDDLSVRTLKMEFHEPDGTVVVFEMSNSGGRILSVNGFRIQYFGVSVQLIEAI